MVDADDVLSVPAGIDLAAAAPLLCAGITTCSPLRRWGAGPGKKVAVVGLGGLGHMAVKLTHASAEVTVRSRSLKKREDGLRLGAHHFHATSDPRRTASSPAPSIGGIAETQDMLDFCAEHGLGADIALIRPEQINDAYERVLASDVRYRFVIDAATPG